jgi:uncharacterized membrane protein
MYTIAYVCIYFVLVAFLIWSELGSQDCITGCNNIDLKQFEDTSEADKLKILTYLTTKFHMHVGWRRALLVALISVFPLTFFLLRRMPDFTEFIITLLLVFTIVYFVGCWFQSRWWLMNDRRLAEQLRQLSNKT